MDLKWIILGLCLYVVIVAVEMFSTNEHHLNNRHIEKKDFAHRCEQGVKMSEFLNYFNTANYGFVSVGTLPQNLNVLFNTGSIITWFYSSKCPFRACKLHRMYNSADSKTFKPSGIVFTSNYLGGNLSGYLSTDKLIIGPYNIKDQTFAEIDVADSVLYEASNFDGVLGLGRGLVAGNAVKSPLYNMWMQGLISAPVFSLYYTNGRWSYIFGEEIPDRAVIVTYVPVANKDSMKWHVRIDNILFDSQKFCEGCIASVDSGISTLVGPMKEVAAINKVIGGKPFGSGFFKVPCENLNTFPTLQFFFGNEIFVLSATEYITTFTTFEVDVCLSNFVGKDIDVRDEPAWILGQTFLWQFLVQFDALYDRVGFGVFR